MMEISNRDILIWLNSLNIGNKTIERIIDQIPQLVDLWDLPSDKLYSLRNIKSEIKD